MTLVYIRWKDAQNSNSPFAISTLGELAELHECGFLLTESPDTITIGTEMQDGATEARFWLTIPKVNIVEERRTTLSKAFPKPRVKKPLPHAPLDIPAVSENKNFTLESPD